MLHIENLRTVLTQLRYIVGTVPLVHSVSYSVATSTAGRRFSTRIIESYFSQNILSSPLDSDLLTVSPEKINVTSTFYSKSQSFKSGTKIWPRLIYYRLHADHHNVFKAAAGVSYCVQSRSLSFVTLWVLLSPDKRTENNFSTNQNPRRTPLNTATWTFVARGTTMLSSAFRSS